MNKSAFAGASARQESAKSAVAEGLWRTRIAKNAHKFAKKVRKNEKKG
jgi:hypothetical protein